MGLATQRYACNDTTMSETPTTLNVSTGTQVTRTQAAAIMYGAGSKQHLAAIARFGA